MNEAETKTCPMCAETIKAAARVCPHCRYWQKRWSLQNPNVLVSGWVILWTAVLVCLAAFLQKMIGPKHEYAAYRDEISVVESQVSRRLSGTNIYVTVVGTLTNHGKIAWKNVGVEAQFLDPLGKAFDAITVDAGSYRGVVVLPHGIAAFKIEGRAAQPETVYAKYQTTVRWAKDADSWP